MALPSRLLKKIIKTETVQLFLKKYEVIEVVQLRFTWRSPLGMNYTLPFIWKWQLSILKGGGKVLNCKSEVLVDNDKNCQTATAKLSSLKVATYHFQWAGGGGVKCLLCSRYTVRARRFEVMTNESTTTSKIWYK